MKQINGYWIDENNNKWDCATISKEKAIIYSNSLINCKYCKGCKGCKGCNGCNYCNYCKGCNYCRYRIYCKGFKKQPQIYETAKIGSRNDTTIFYYDKDTKHLQIVCGCFEGDLEQFEKAVMKTHKNNDVYKEQYLKEIKKVKYLFDIGE